MAELVWEHRPWEGAFFRWALCKVDGGIQQTVVGLRLIAGIHWDAHMRKPGQQTEIRHLGNNLTDDEAKAVALALYRMG